MQCGWNPEKSADKEGNTALSLPAGKLDAN